MDLENLLLELQQGKMQALEHIYVLTNTAVYAQVYAILRHPQSTEDVMQDTYFAVLKNISRYAPQGKPKAWIVTIARNQALSYLKKNPGGQFSPLDDSIPASEPPEDAGMIDIAQRVLKKDEFELVMLHSVSGFTHKEIAEISGTPYATVRWQYQNALGKLKKYLEENKISL